MNICRRATEFPETPKLKSLLARKEVRMNRESTPMHANKKTALIRVHLRHSRFSLSRDRHLGRSQPPISSPLPA